MFAGGWLSNVGWTALPLVMLVGALAADNASYWVGRLGGRALLDRVAGNRLLSRLLDTGHLDRAERYFQAHGGKTVVVGRFTPGMRGPTPLFAGASKISYPRFAAFNGTAVVLWAVTYALVCYAFGEYWDELLSTVRSSGLDRSRRRRARLRGVPLPAPQGRETGGGGRGQPGARRMTQPERGESR